MLSAVGQRECTGTRLVRGTPRPSWQGRIQRCGFGREPEHASRTTMASVNLVNVRTGWCHLSSERTLRAVHASQRRRQGRQLSVARLFEGTLTALHDDRQAFTDRGQGSGPRWTAHHQPSPQPRTGTTAPASEIVTGPACDARSWWLPPTRSVAETFTEGPREQMAVKQKNGHPERGADFRSDHVSG